MIMLTAIFIHVDVQQSGQGNQHTGNSYVKHKLPAHLPLQLSELGNRQTLNSSVKHRLAPPTQPLHWHVLDAINESLKEKNR